MLRFDWVDVELKIVVKIASLFFLLLQVGMRQGR